MSSCVCSMHKNLKVSVEAIAECEGKAQRIIETLIEKGIDEATFLRQLGWINRNHYQCIVEERAVQKVCGYALCVKQLVNIPKKKYHICTRNNIVYDLAERKNFCSNQCYKASLFLKEQLLESPLWMREEEDEPVFKLLKNSAELPGDEIRFKVERVTIAEPVNIFNETCEEDDIASAPSVGKCVWNYCFDDEISMRDRKTNTSAQKYSQFENPSHGSLRIADTSVSGGCRRVKSLTVVSEGCSSRVNSKDSPVIQTCSESNDVIRTFVSSFVGQNPTFSSGLVSYVEKSLREWLTLDTFSFIMGIEMVKQMLDRGKEFVVNEFGHRDPYSSEFYVAICRKLNILELEEEKQANTKECDKPMSPLDYVILRNETQEIEMKVRDFYRGDKKVTFDQNQNEDEDGMSVVIPPLYQRSEGSIRLNIVLDKLRNVIPDLASILGLQIINVDEKIKQLMSTCKFNAHNIIFKPFEWNLIGLILIKLLSVRDSTFQKSFHEKTKYVNAILMSYQLEKNYLELLCTWLLDLNEILKNENSELSTK